MVTKIKRNKKKDNIAFTPFLTTTEDYTMLEFILKKDVASRQIANCGPNTGNPRANMVSNCKPRCYTPKSKKNATALREHQIGNT